MTTCNTERPEKKVGSKANISGITGKRLVNYTIQKRVKSNGLTQAAKKFCYSSGVETPLFSLLFYRLFILHKKDNIILYNIFYSGWVDFSGYMRIMKAYRAKHKQKNILGGTKNGKRMQRIREARRGRN